MITSGMDIQYLIKQIEDKINHQYIEQIVGKPHIDESKLVILANLVGRHPSLSEIEKEKLVITAMLVQIALDTHEQVPTWFKPDISNKEQERNHLRVLAGDYYSGLYYLMLSEIDAFDLIRTLASAIKEINEYKMKLYYLDYNFNGEYIDIVKKIEALLIYYVADYVNDSSLNELVGEWLIINRLYNEKQNIEDHKESTLLNKWLHNNSNYTSFISHANSIIQTKTDTLNELLDVLPQQYGSLKNYLNVKLNKENQSKASIVEEG
ncbi:heptaprenyl diphosphate synthase [Oceanobacillus halophilus]|uniref:Heptaprenyl diphosphate synthase n=1 Tax=Oceanobacillus halophilus TaxID=930130 RepID=A0A495ADR9_9BACI|nr:heptaprenyl diphosphate synthase [Oceanobacillus halophilus]